jgi:hypothetical protein
MTSSVTVPMNASARTRPEISFSVCFNPYAPLFLLMVVVYTIQAHLSRGFFPRGAISCTKSSHNPLRRKTQIGYYFFRVKKTAVFDPVFPVSRREYGVL